MTENIGQDVPTTATPVRGQDIIFTPLPFKNLEVKNRIFRSSVSGRFDNEDGSLTQTRINWECKFAKGGIGAIISSYVPVLMEGRIIAGYATVHRDEFIPYWQKLGEAVHSFDCKFIMQLSHSGRQMDVPGVHNYARPTLSSTSKKESLHGFLCRAMTLEEICYTIDSFAKGAWRAREAGLDGVELHAANGYLFTQFLSSGINDRTDAYGGSLANRARFLLDVISAIREKVGSKFHLQVKISAVDHNNVVPWEKKGNTLDESVQIAKWCETAGADAIHVSTGSLFPHPLNPPGGFSFETIAATYDAMISSGVSTLRNYFLFRYPILRPNRHRIDMWTTKARDAYNNYRTGYNWNFSHFQKTEGYVAETLDGLWLRAPYLHNGSVPTLSDLLEVPQDRPKAFLRGEEVLDSMRGGFVAPACDPARPQKAAFCFDTAMPGNANSGHVYGTDLTAADKADLLAFLLTL